MGVYEQSDARPDGQRLGQSAADLVGFHGATPTAQGSAITSPATAASTTTTPAGYLTTTQADAVVTALNGVLTVLRTKGIIAS